MNFKNLLYALLMIALLPAVRAHAGLVAAYDFNHTLASSIGGAPALTAIDPEGVAGYSTASVFGNSQTVYHFGGNQSPADEQGGLALDTAGLLNPTNYSAEMIFRFNENPTGWKRIFSAENRDNDQGLYVDFNQRVAAYEDYAPTWGSEGSTAWTNNEFHHLVFSQSSSGQIQVYLDGNLEIDFTSTIFNIDGADSWVTFFLDNTEDINNEEYSSGEIALLRLYDGALSGNEVASLYAPADQVNPVVPEPATLSLIGLGLATTSVLRRRTRRKI